MMVSNIRGIGCCGDRIVAVALFVACLGFAMTAAAAERMGAADANRFKVLTVVGDIYQVPPAEFEEVHRVQLEFVVYYYDPAWKVMWGRNGNSDNYVSLHDWRGSLRPGQRVLIEGEVVPARGTNIEHTTVKVLADAVPLPVMSVDGDAGDVAKLNHHLVSITGYVDRQLNTDPDHVELDLVAGDRLITARVLAQDGVAPLEGCIVRVKGVYSATADPAGGLPKIEVWVQDKRDLQVEGRLDGDRRFDLPLTPIDQIPTVPRGAVVRIAGTVRAQQPGTTLTIRDETGQILVRSPQVARLALGSAVDAIGVPSRLGLEWVLVHGLYRERRGTTRSAANAAVLRLAEQIRNLSADEASRRRPVKLTGVVTWANPQAGFFFVTDISGGVRVMQPPGRPAAVIVGLRVEVTGVSGVGPFTPEVLASNVHYTATVDLPEARPVMLEQALTGVEEAQWVSMSGYVRAVAREGVWERLEMTTSGGEFSAVLPPDAQLETLVGSVVRVRGVCGAIANRKRQLTGIQVWVPSLEYVEIEEHAPRDPFAVALHSVASLRQFNSPEALNRRVRVVGIVLSQVPGRSIHLQDGTDGLLVLSRGTTPVQPGDRLEAVGFPGRESTRAVLREAVYRRIGGGAEPSPLPVANVLLPDAELDGRLVRIEAQLLDVGNQPDGTRLILQAGKVFEAFLDTDRGGARWAPGSRVALTGVYEIQFDESRRPQSVRLRLRTPEDVRVLQRPSWWTARRALTLTGFLAVAVVLGGAWVMALRRRVRRQTEQIRDQVENERAARLEAALARASKLESVGVLAGGIAHDFNNLLTVVMCNLSLARLEPGLSPDTERCLRESERATTRARDLTRQLLTFAKGGAPVRTAVAFGDLVRESAEFALHGSRSRCQFDLAGDLWPAHVDKGQVGQVVQNIVINANQAMPAGGVIAIAVRNADVEVGAVPGLMPGRYLKLTVSDTGCGIAPEIVPRIFDPYFTTKPHGSGLGLATVYSIVKQHHGHVEVASVPDHGSTFTVWLPAADVAPAPAAAPAVEPARRTGRVLFMDDEPSIRQMARMMFRRMGLDVTDVPDGAAVVQEYAAARAAGKRYDVVVLDLTVPGGMGGAEAMHKLREIDPGVVAVVSSGYSNDPIMANFRAYGFAAVVAKPYEAAVLARTIDAVMGRDRAEPGTEPNRTQPVR
ncbi:MAG TPA: ATP-binding protein [Opitutaceae bacterium]|nr:ATP-binding protein [Opitutaceae bacterium]